MSSANAIHLPGISVPVPSRSGLVWNPVPEGLNQIVQLFRDDNDSAFLNEQYKQLQILSQHPEFHNYLVFILSSGGDSVPEFIRCRAGLQLKNSVKDSYDRIHESVREYMKQHVLATLGDPSSYVRNTVGTIITTIAVKEQLKWPGMLEFLVHLLDSGKDTYMDGAFNALSKICEDLTMLLDDDSIGRPLNFLIPKFITFFLHQNETIRKHALSSVNVFLANRPQALVVNMDAYMRALFALSSDPSKEIRKRVCQAFVILVDVSFDHLSAHLDDVVRFMLAATGDENTAVALEACEFWTVFCENDRCSKGLLEKYLEPLTRVLLQQMKYTDLDLCIMGDDNDEEGDSFIPDRTQDIKPRFHKTKSAVSGGGGGGGAPAAGSTADNSSSSSSSSGDGDDSDGEDEDDDDDDDEEVHEWNLRKCSAASLDTIANTYSDKLLPVLLPLLQSTLVVRGATKSEDEVQWKVRESAVLALGAVAEGCYSSMSPYLEQLIPFLLTLLKDTRPLVRSITCWTLSRYSRWVLDNHDRKFFPPLLAELLRRVLDKNKKVQEAACSALATLEEEAADALVPYLKNILETLMYAFHRYQAKNMLILYDAIGTLGEAVGSDLNKPEAIQLLMPPLMERWNSLADNDRNIFPLLECLTSVASALGAGFVRFAQPVFDRCCQIIQNTIIAHARAVAAEEQNQEAEFPDTEFIVCALDLLSGMCEGLFESMEPLVGTSPTLLGLLFECVKHTDPDVRQSAFALLGDLAKFCIGHLLPYVKDFIPVAAHNLNPKFISVCNNASWSIGEIAVKVGAEPMRPFVTTLIQYLTPLMNTGGSSVPPSLLENTAITIGRLAMVCPELVAPALPEIARSWCLFIARIRDRREKEHAFKGLCNVLAINPTGMLNSFSSFVFAIQQWSDAPEEVTVACMRIIQAYKSTFSEQWPQLLQQLPNELLQFIQREFA